jgi:hypothetical protein
VDLQEIILKKKRGDIAMAGLMLSISPQNAYNAFMRPKSKYHNQIIEALREVIVCYGDVDHPVPGQIDHWVS